MTENALLDRRLAAFRARLADFGLDGFVVPHADEFQNEYLPACSERLAWLTGFTGSAGQAVVTMDRAAIFVDGRYTLQVRAEAPAELYEHRHLVEDTLEGWVAEAMAPGMRLGFDPRLHTPAWTERIRKTLERGGIGFVACLDNPVDAVWTDRPERPATPVVLHPIAFTGRAADEKCAEAAAALRRQGRAAAILTLPESTGWLLNIRGGDVANTPLVLCWSILHDDASVDLFIDSRKLAPDLAEALGPMVRPRPVEAFAEGLEALGRKGGRVLVDSTSVSAWIVERLTAAGAVVDQDADPCTLPRACKNATELAGARAAHRRDGVAMVRFLRWLSQEGAPVTEIGAAERLLAFRAEGEHFRGSSFDTISAAGANGAIVHYHVTPKSDRTLEPGGLYLIDSGAQYLDGTTDVTRTLAIGTPTEEMRRRFTRVLMGHIALGTVRFPAGTTGSQLDALARVALWAEGLDYDHGTGHGVGSYLSVHERPQRISKVGNTVALQLGMILSNEPGYYAAGAYGIRIENLIAVVPADIAGAERPMLAFETLTLVPYDRRLIDVSLLNSAEAAWIDSYHARVCDRLSGALDSDTAAWLREATAPLER